MATWAYRCYSPDEPGTSWFVSQLALADLPPDVVIVRVKIGSHWRCAVVDRSRRVEVESQLVRDVIASNEDDCPECAAFLADASSVLAERAEGVGPPAPAATGTAASEAVPPPRPAGDGPRVQAAAISLRGTRFAVVVVSLDLVHSPGEAQMACDDLSPYFAGVPIVLLAQADDGTPHYFGEPGLVQLVTTIPLDKMPWQEYGIG